MYGNEKLYTQESAAIHDEVVILETTGEQRESAKERDLPEAEPVEAGEDPRRSIR